MIGKTAGQDVEGSRRLRKKSRRAYLKKRVFDDLPALIRLWTVRLSIRHLHGPRKIPCAPNEMVVLCVARNAGTYIKPFIEHYLSMGAKHVVFLDNGSEDDSVSIARNHERVTVLRTKLSFKKYRLEMKQYLVYRFGKDRWSLSVDQDELFDYPYSDAVSLKSLLGYLNDRSYTTVVTQLLDMFPDRPLSSRAGREDGSLKELYRFYDISDIEKEDYKRRSGPRKSNAVSNKDIKVYKGGIRKTLFDTGASLTKHSLTFFGGGVKPLHGTSHHTKDASVADFSCVLYHYKFIDGFREHAEWAIREDAYPSRPSGRHEKYVETMDQAPEMKISRPTSRELGSVNELVDNGFLAVSKKYKRWATAGKDAGAASLGMAREARNSIPRPVSYSGDRVTSGEATSFLVSFCNVDRIGDPFLALVDARSGEVRWIEIEGKPAAFAGGVTGLCRYGDLVCATFPGGKNPSSFAILDPGDWRVLSWAELPAGPHSVCTDGENLYFGISSRDSIYRASRSAEGWAVEPFWTLPDSSGQKDRNHLNAVAFVGGRLCASVFGPRPARDWNQAEQGFILDVERGERLSSESVYHPHSLLEISGVAWTCESKTNQLLSVEGRRLRVPSSSYLRGLAADDDNFYVGSSKRRVTSQSTGKRIHGAPKEMRGVCRIYRVPKDGSSEPSVVVDFSEVRDEIYDILPL